MPDPREFLKALKAIDISLTLIFVILCFLWAQSCSMIRAVDRVADEIQKSRYELRK